MFVFTAIRRRRRRRREQLLQRHQQPQNRPSVRVTTRNHILTESNAPLGVTDMERNMPFLYSLARSWAWDAVTHRCRTHPRRRPRPSIIWGTRRSTGPPSGRRRCRPSRPCWGRTPEPPGSGTRAGRPRCTWRARTARPAPWCGPSWTPIPRRRASRRGQRQRLHAVAQPLRLRGEHDK